jgi:hypothetical protein
MTSSGIEPATFRLVVQYFNYATACPYRHKWDDIKTDNEEIRREGVDFGF